MQACRHLVGRLRDLGLGYVYRSEAVAEHLLMEGADGGAVPGKRDARRSRKQMGGVIDESGGPDGRVADGRVPNGRVPNGRVPDGGRIRRIHGPIMPGAGRPSLPSPPWGSGRH